MINQSHEVLNNQYHSMLGSPYYSECNSIPIQDISHVNSTFGCTFRIRPFSQMQQFPMKGYADMSQVLGGSIDQVNSTFRKLKIYRSFAMHSAGNTRISSGTRARTVSSQTHSFNDFGHLNVFSSIVITLSGSPSPTCPCCKPASKTSAWSVVALTVARLPCKRSKTKWPEEEYRANVRQEWQRRYTTGAYRLPYGTVI